MAQDQSCEKCSQKHNCREVFQQLGNAEGPSVVFKVLFAFLLPVVVFILVLTILDKFLVTVVNAGSLRTVVSFLLALSATFILILVTKYVSDRLPEKE